MSSLNFLLTTLRAKALPAVLTAILVVVGGGVMLLVIHARQTDTAGPEPMWVFPFTGGVWVSLGVTHSGSGGGLHPDGDSTSVQKEQIGKFTLDNAQQPDSSIDLGLLSTSPYVNSGVATTPTVALTSGIVLATNPACHEILINHHNGWWVLYRHQTQIAVSPGNLVQAGTPIGYATLNVNGPDCQESATFVHVHFSFLQGPDVQASGINNGATGQFVSAAGRVLCGHLVLSNSDAYKENHDSSLNLRGLGRNFQIPNQCYTQHIQGTQAGQVLHVKGRADIEVESNGQLIKVAGRCGGDGTVTDATDHDVVVIDNDEIRDVNGDVYYHVAYRDPCRTHRDFSTNEDIKSGKGAVGYINSSPNIVEPISAVKASIPTAAWRNCWEPTCGDQHLGDIPSGDRASAAPKWGDSLARADSAALYAWRDGRNGWWDPHWFHVLDNDGKPIAVYGTDWEPSSQAPQVQCRASSIGAAPPDAPVWAHAYTAGNVSDACPTPTPGPTPTPRPTPTASPTPTPAPYQPSWHQALSEAAPSCNIPSGEHWYNPLPTNTACNSSGFIQQQISQNYYGETDLQYFNGPTYDEANSWAKLTATYLNPSDTSTYAAMIVQTPRDQSAGGYIFGVNSNGDWRLQEVVSGSSIPTRASNSTHRYSTSHRIEVQVHGGQLIGFVDGQQVVTWSENLSGATEMGIMTQKDFQPSSSQVQYNSFELWFWY